MKKILFLIVLSTFYLTVGISTVQNDDLSDTIYKITKIKHNYELLVRSEFWIESRNNMFAIGDAGDIGGLQITDIRRIDYFLKTGIYYHAFEMFDSAKSREIFDYYAYKIGIENHEEIARRWNRSSNWKDEKGRQYWNLVYNRYKKLV